MNPSILIMQDQKNVNKKLEQLPELQWTMSAVCQTKMFEGSHIAF